MMDTEWVLRGTHPNYASGNPIDITGGSLSHCNRELKYRKAMGFTNLTIRKEA